MAKSQIIKDLISGKIELAQALERVLVIAMEINDADTIKWVKCEKNGYGSDDFIPKYRTISLTPMGSYQMISMGYIHRYTNQPLATIGVPDDLKESYRNHKVGQGVSQLIEQSKALEKDSSLKCGIAMPPEFYHYFEEGTNVQVTNAFLYYSQEALGGIIDAVRTRTIELLVLMEKNFGVLDDLDIDLGDYKSEEIEKLQEACSVVIKGDNVGDTYIITDSKVKKSNIGKGNSADKESKVEISPTLNIEKENGKSILKKVFGFLGGIK